MSKVKVFYVEYTPKHRRQIAENLQPLLVRLFGSVDTSITIVDNSGLCEPFYSPVDPTTEFPKINVISGENSSREFSGWQTAIDKNMVEDDDIVCLCNDTFAKNNGTAYLDWFQKNEVLKALDNHTVVGYADSRRNESQIFALHVRRWIRTSIFFVRGQDLRKLLPMTLPVSDQVIFNESGPSLFTPTAPIDLQTRQWIEHWLIRGPRVPGESIEQWYLAEPLNEKNRTFMQLKAKAILGELYFSAKIQAAGLGIFDVRRSRRRKLGAYYWLAKLGLLDMLQEWRRKT